MLLLVVVDVFYILLLYLLHYSIVCEYKSAVLRPRYIDVGTEDNKMHSEAYLNHKTSVKQQVRELVNTKQKHNARKTTYFNSCVQLPLKF